MSDWLRGSGRIWRRVLLAALVAGLCLPADAFEPEDIVERRALEQQITLGTGFLDPVTTPLIDSVIGQCVEWGDVFFMLTPTMTKTQARQFVDGLPPLRERRYQTHTNYWVRTATNGNVSLPGQRITLTWSFVPDGTMIRKAYEPGDAPSNLHAAMNSVFASEELWKNQFRRAFNEFGQLIGVNYVEVSDDGAQQPAIGVLGVRGDVRIAMIPMQAGGVLAFNYYPISASQINSSNAGLGGDMVFNSTFLSLLSSSSNQYRYLRNVIMHEHGHGIGYRHVDPINQTKLMEAFATAAFDGPQEDDIRGFQNGYGDRFEVNTTPAMATSIGPLPTVPSEPPLLLDNLAMENSFARDFFRIQAPDLTVLRARVEPFGTLYQQGPQDGPVSNVNGKAVLDLVIDVMGADGVTPLLTVDEMGLGEGEELGYPLILGAGEYLLRVRSKGTNDQSQRYRLWLWREEGFAEARYVLLNSIVDDSAGNATGSPDPGESGVSLAIPLRNIGFASGPPFTATLISDTPTVVITSAVVEYGPASSTQIAEPGTKFRFNVSPEHECGAPIAFRLLKSLTNGDQETAFELSTGVTGAAQPRQYTDFLNDPLSVSYLSVSNHMVPHSFPVGEVRINDLNVTASLLENHRFILVSPEGLQVVLSDGNFRGSNLRGTNLRQDGLSLSAGVAPYTGTFRPANPLSAVAGGDSLGVWQLMVLNKLGARAASIDSWTLELVPFYEETYCETVLIPPGELIESFAVY